MITQSSCVEFAVGWLNHDCYSCHCFWQAEIQKSWALGYELVVWRYDGIQCYSVMCVVLLYRALQCHVNIKLHPVLCAHFLWHDWIFFCIPWFDCEHLNAHTLLSRRLFETRLNLLSNLAGSKLFQPRFLISAVRRCRNTDSEWVDQLFTNFQLWAVDCEHQIRSFKLWFCFFSFALWLIQWQTRRLKWKKKFRYTYFSTSTRFSFFFIYLYFLHSRWLHSQEVDYSVPLFCRLFVNI